MISLPVLLAIGALLFGVGLYGVLSQTNTVMIIMGVELMLGAAALNLIAFARYSWPVEAGGSFFVLVILTLMAVEAVIGFALVIAVFRNQRTAETDDLSDLRG